MARHLFVDTRAASRYLMGGEFIMKMVHFIPPNQRRLAMLAAQAETAPVLISGASGTGKGAIAKWIHLNSPRSAKPIIETNLNKPLIKQIPEARGGSLVVSEVAELPLSEQKVLLNLLNTHSIPHPDNTGMRMLVNVRVIATTGHILEARAQGGLFNPDLLEKLNVFRLEMPALAKRIEEFDDIAIGIVNEITHELHKEHIRKISQTALIELRAYDWPGNLRELRNVLKIAVLAAKSDSIEFGDLPEFGHDRVDFRATREKFEKIYIQELLKTFNWQIDKTCKATRMDKQALLSKIEKYGIKPTALSSQ